MSLFGRNRRSDVPELDVQGEEATLTPRADDGADEAPPASEPGEPRVLKLPKTKWY